MDMTFYANRPVENYHKVDIWLLISILLLWGLGIFTLFICSQSFAERMFHNSMYFVNRQLICSALGFVLFLAFLFVDMNSIKKIVGIIVIVAIVLCLLTFIPPLGVEKNGARRWIRMPFNFSFQPSELVKFAVVLFLSNYFEKQSEIDDPEEKTVFPAVIGFTLMFCLVFAQKDFSTGLFIFIIGVLLFFASGSKLTWIIPFSVVAIPGLILMISLEPYRLERIIGFLRPDEYANGVNYQILQAKRAISAGGFWGNGIGTGLVRINSIPEIQADYIFAGWTEAMGLLGVFIYIILLGFFAYRGYRTSLLCPKRFDAYTSFGCVSIIVLQSLINCAVVCGLFPTTGIPLPFFSLGGSSIIVTLAMSGIILNASRCEEKTERKSRKSDDINIESITFMK